MDKKSYGSLLQSVVISLLVVLPSYSQQIITDGKTNTTLQVNNNVTNVTTSTLYSTTALNSFKKFNVDEGNVVNLHHPLNSQRLVNLIKDEKTQINGILNSIKNGHISGDVFFVNPYGVTVGQGGVINVSSLTIVTPNLSEVNNFFYPDNKVNPTAINNLLNNKLQINSQAQVVNDGVINAITKVRIDTGSCNNSGKISTAAIYKENNIAMGDVVNINDIDTLPTMIKYNGSIYINATQEIINSGKLTARGGYKLSGGSIVLNASDINLTPDSELSTTGKGYRSNGGNILLTANNIGNNSSSYDTGAGSTGNAGYVKLAAKNNVNIEGLNFKALVYSGYTNNITVESPNIFAEGNIKTNASDIYFTATKGVKFTDNTLITTKSLNAVGLSNRKSGNLKINTPGISFANGQTVIDTSADNNFNSGAVTILSDVITNVNGLKHTINAGNNNVVFNRKSLGDININNGNQVDAATNEITGDVGMFASQDSFNLSAQKITFGITSAADKITAQNLNVNLDLNLENNLALCAAKKVNLTNNVTAKNVEIFADVAISGAATIKAINNISLNSPNGQIGTSEQYLNVDEGAIGNLTSNSKLNTYLSEVNGDMRINVLKSVNDIYLRTNGNIINARPTAGSNIIANNLFVIKHIDAYFTNGNYYMFGIDDDPFGNNSQTSIFDVYKQVFRTNGQNWAKMPESNFRLYDSDREKLTKTAILNGLKEFANKTSEKDMLFIMYEGHGGFSSQDRGEIDENNGIAQTPVDEYMGLYGISITDDEFASALSGAKGTVVFVTSQCYGGGMFGGSADIDQVAIKNGFKFFGMSGTNESTYAWASYFSRFGVNSYTGFIHQNLINSAMYKESCFYSYDQTYTGYKGYKGYKNDYAFNANGNLYLDEWHSAINKKDVFYVPYQNSVYSYSYNKYTNMTSDDLINNPIVIKNWDSPFVDNSFVTQNIGTDTKPLVVDLKGILDANVKGNINISGTINKSNIISETGNVNLSGYIKGSTKVKTQGNITLTGLGFDIYLDSLDGNNVVVTQKTYNKNILNARTDTAANVIGNNITLTDAYGYVGTLKKKLNVDIKNGKLTVNARSNKVYINEVNK